MIGISINEEYSHIEFCPVFAAGDKWMRRLRIKINKGSNNYKKWGEWGISFNCWNLWVSAGDSTYIYDAKRIKKIFVRKLSSIFRLSGF